MTSISVTLMLITNINQHTCILTIQTFMMIYSYPEVHYPCTTLRTIVPNIAKESYASHLFTLPFLLAFSWFSCHHPFTLMDPTNLVVCHTLTFSFPYTCTSVIQVFHYMLGSTKLSQSSINFLLSQPIPKTLKT